MSGLLTLLSLSIVMAVASFLAGTLPLSFHLSPSQLRLISTIGMGVLVGTSLIVIIPEGVETLYTASGVNDGHAKRAMNHLADEIRWAHPPSRAQHLSVSLNDLHHRDITELEDLGLPGPVIPDSIAEPPRTPTESGRVGIMDSEGDSHGKQSQEVEHEDNAHHAWIGVALISGFILMFLVDKIPQLAPPPKPMKKTHNIALNNIGRRFNLSSSHNQEDEEADSFLETHPTPEPPKRGFATTIGLVIHAAADGIALGASSSTSHTSLSLIIFFAIMIHKAPAAFGLTSILLRQGLSKRMARTHLVLFSLAAPCGALLTWIAARILGSGPAHNESNTKWWTGILLLFSAGTFLYVAMHSMQEVLGGHHRVTNDTNGHVPGPLERRDSTDLQMDEKTSLKDVAAAVFGMILPLFLQVGHAH